MLSQEFSILFGSYYFTVSYLITHGLIAWSVLLARGKDRGLFANDVYPNSMAKRSTWSIYLEYNQTVLLSC